MGERISTETVAATLAALGTDGEVFARAFLRANALDFAADLLDARRELERVRTQWQADADDCHAAVQALMGRPTTTRVDLTPAQMERLRAAGWEPGSMALGEWLVGAAADLLDARRERDEVVEVMRTVARPDASDLQAHAKSVVARFTDMAKERITLYRRMRRLQQEREGDVWLWMGDGSDDAESLACPVLMGPEQVRSLIAERDEARAELERARAVAHDLRTRAGSCRDLIHERPKDDAERLRGKASAYEHAAEMIEATP